MRKTPFLLALATFLSASLSSQNPFESAYQTFEVTPAKVYVEKTFYPEKKQITHLVSYSDKKRKTKNGPYQEWYDNGNKWVEGQYVNNERQGPWTFYSFDKEAISEYGNYENGKREGTWTSLDTLGRKTSESHYVFGEMQGERKVFDTLGEVVRLQVFKKGELVSDTRLEGGVALEQDISQMEELPFLKGCEQEDKALQRKCSEQLLLETLYKNIKYPALARENGIQGQALIRFVIEKDGTLTHLQTMRGICRGIEEECLRVINLLPEWNPGRQNGEPVRVTYTLPIRFKLE